MVWARNFWHNSVRFLTLFGNLVFLAFFWQKLKNRIWHFFVFFSPNLAFSGRHYKIYARGPRVWNPLSGKEVAISKKSDEVYILMIKCNTCLHSFLSLCCLPASDDLSLFTSLCLLSEPLSTFLPCKGCTSSLQRYYCTFQMHKQNCAKKHPSKAVLPEMFRSEWGFCQVYETAWKNWKGRRYKKLSTLVHSTWRNTIWSVTGDRLCLFFEPNVLIPSRLDMRAQHFYHVAS